jgi:hypothetical protein
VITNRVPELALAAASPRLRDVPGFPRRPGRPRKDGTLARHASALPSAPGNTQVSPPRARRRAQGITSSIRAEHSTPPRPAPYR